MDTKFVRSKPKLPWQIARATVILLLMSAFSAPCFSVDIRFDESNLSDWCIGAKSVAAGRTENRAVQLTCGNCSVVTSRACVVDADCMRPDLVFPPTNQLADGGTCIPGTKTETAWWDDRTDGAVNDLATVAFAQDADYLYVGAELWVDPDPVSLPFGQIALDFKPGGLNEWHDPRRVLVAPGNCSISTDRACTSNADCSFCGTSRESTGVCSTTTTTKCVDNTQCPVGETCNRRVRTCGSACDAGDTCNTSQTCVNLGSGGLKSGVGGCAGPGSQADYLLLFDFSFWLSGADQKNSCRLVEPRTSSTLPEDPVLLPSGPSPWAPVRGCPFDTGDTNDYCDFVAGVNPGASGGSGGPPGSVEVRIPWSAFAGSGFGPGVPFRFTMLIARGASAVDFKPFGAIEDLLSESVAPTTTNSRNSCPGAGIGTTLCELANGSSDAYVPRSTSFPYDTAVRGRAGVLNVGKGTVAGSITLSGYGSCAPADTNFEVYEGTIGAWGSHQSVSCSANCGLTLTPHAAANSYYLVVPSDGTNEGSYGLRRLKDTLGNVTFPERPPAGVAFQCVPQSIGTCP